MAPHVFALNRRGPIPPTVAFSAADAPTFAHGDGGQAYHLVEDDDTAVLLRQKERKGVPYFRDITAERLESVLESAEEAAAAIEAGEHDDELDLLLFAERQHYGPRVTVTDAIDERQQAIEREFQAEEAAANTLSVDDVAPGRGRVE